MKSYRIKFERIGRNHSVADLVTSAGSLEDLAEKIHGYARPFVLSRHYAVELNVVDDEGEGCIICGMRPAGDFSIGIEAQP
jgi:hypothetical protein